MTYAISPHRAVTLQPIKWGSMLQGPKAAGHCSFPAGTDSQIPLNGSDWCSPSSRPLADTSKVELKLTL
jgi:hypothetical protein